MSTASTTPTLRELQRHVTPQYAADFREIGVELGLTDAKLREIEAGYPTNFKWCCNRMFAEWLRVDTTASWEKLFTAIESPAVSSGPVRGNYIIHVQWTLTSSSIVHVLCDVTYSYYYNDKFCLLGQEKPKLNMDKLTTVKGEVYCSVFHISYCLSCRTDPEGGHE